jgi:hypothetical protein
MAWAVAVAAWVGLVGVGFRALILHESTAGAQSLAPQRWPDALDTARDSSRATLVIVLHASCPCSRATVAELGRLMARVTPDRLTARVLFVVPTGMHEDPRDSALWSQVAIIPGVSASVDPGGRAARQFGALTSGQAILFDAAGKRIFQGGITASRAHEGDNQGRAAIEALVANEPAPGRTDVYGCALGVKEGTNP